MKSIKIDLGKRLKDAPSTGHNRFHPDIPPILDVDEGEEVVLETRDGWMANSVPPPPRLISQPWRPGRYIPSPGQSL